MPIRENIVYANSLDIENLMPLIEDRTLVLVIKNYCSTEVINNFVRYIKKTPKEEYLYLYNDKDRLSYKTLGVERIGIPLNSTYGNVSGSRARRRYFEKSIEQIREIRKVCAPFVSPLDRLRLELEEIWPQGANVATFDGEKAFAGIIRVMKSAESSKIGVQPHFDSLPINYDKLQKQFSANIYIQTPASGGELEIWDVPPLSNKDISVSNSKKDWRRELPQSTLIKPEEGDLFLFNTRRPHAIQSFPIGERSSLQCFIGLTASNKLILWS